MSNVKTIDLTGEETEVNFEQKFMCFWVQNMGSGDVYASIDAGVAPDKDGVIFIGAGASARVSAADLSQKDRLYITGSGKVQVMGSYSDECPFTRKKKGGDGNNVLAEYSLTENFDGYGCDIFNIGSATEANFNDGLFLTKNSYFTAKLKCDLKTIENFKITFEANIFNNNYRASGQLITNYVDSSNTWTLQTVSGNKYQIKRNNTINKGETSFPLDEWHTVSFIFEDYQKRAAIQIDDSEPNYSSLSLDNVTPNNNQDFIFNSSGAAVYTRIKNLKIIAY